MTRIEICGGIAAGKTTLASLLVKDGSRVLVTERFRDNPFWAQFYESPEAWMEEKNFCFLLQHTAAIKAVQGYEHVVCDYGVFQDLAYASLVPRRTHLELMQRLYTHLYQPLGAPALIVQLQCPPEVELERIRARARSEESVLTLDYLTALDSAIDVALKTVATTTKVHAIASDKVDFAHVPSVASQAVAEILEVLSRRSRGQAQDYSVPPFEIR